MGYALAKYPGLFFHGTSRKAKETLLKYSRPAVTFPPVRSGLVPSEEVEAFFCWLFNQVGLRSACYRSMALSRRLPACLRFLKVANVQEARRKLIAQPELHPLLMNVVLLGVTEFYRDRPVFESVRESVVPRLLALPAPIRIWSPACSDGQELYSIAILFAEAGRLGDCELLGTDCRPQAIAQARLAEYKTEILGGLELKWRKAYFSYQDDHARAHRLLRDAVVWKVANLLAEVESGPWNLISWRNMAIYLEPAAAQEIWQRLSDELAPGGYFLTGKADHPPAHLRLERVTACIYRKPHPAT